MDLDIKPCVVIVDHPDARPGIALVTGVMMIKEKDGWPYHPCFQLTYEDEEIDYIRVEDQRFLNFFDIKLKPGMLPAVASLGKLLPYACGEEG